MSTKRKAVAERLELVTGHFIRYMQEGIIDPETAVDMLNGAAAMALACMLGEERAAELVSEDRARMIKLINDAVPDSGWKELCRGCENCHDGKCTAIGDKNIPLN